VTVERTGQRGRRPRESFADRRARRGAVDDPAVVLEAAARFLEARSRSIAEVRRRLTGAGYRDVLVEGAIARLGDLGVLDDDAFARAWVESRDRARPRGERAIREELRLKGIERSIVDAVLDERRTRDGGDGSPGGAADADAVAADRLLAKHARALRRVADPHQRRQRAYALLARNGFDPETCRRLAATVADEPDPDADAAATDD
jgi:regulatory protein